MFDKIIKESFLLNTKYQKNLYIKNLVDFLFKKLSVFDAFI